MTNKIKSELTCSKFIFRWGKKSLFTFPSRHEIFFKSSANMLTMRSSVGVKEIKIDNMKNSQKFYSKRLFPFL